MEQGIIPTVEQMKEDLIMLNKDLQDIKKPYAGMIEMGDWKPKNES